MLARRQRAPNTSQTGTEPFGVYTDHLRCQVERLVADVVQCGSSLEPFDLVAGHGVLDRNKGALASRGVGDLQLNLAVAGASEQTVKANSLDDVAGTVTRTSGGKSTGSTTLLKGRCLRDLGVVSIVGET